MTWPFENDTNAVVKRLAINSTKSDKRSRLFLLLTIALSVCMVFSILLISIGTQEAYKDTQRNKAQIAILGVTDQQSSSLSENPDVSWVGEYSLIGFFMREKRQYRLRMVMKIISCIKQRKHSKGIYRRAIMKSCFLQTI